MILNSVYTVLIIFILIGIGFFISHRKWVDRSSVQAFPKIILNISLPAQILVSFTQSFSSEQLSASGPAGAFGARLQHCVISLRHAHRLGISGG